MNSKEKCLSFVIPIVGICGGRRTAVGISYKY
jgi:hypothetical protein